MDYGTYGDLFELCVTKAIFADFTYYANFPFQVAKFGVMFIR